MNYTAEFQPDDGTEGDSRTVTGMSSEIVELTTEVQPVEVKRNTVSIPDEPWFDTGPDGLFPNSRIL